MCVVALASTAEPGQQIGYTGKTLHPSSKTLEEVMLMRQHYPSLYADPDSSVAAYMSRPGSDFADPAPPRRPAMPGPASAMSGSARPERDPARSVGAEDDELNMDALFSGEDAATAAKRARKPVRKPLTPNASLRGAARPDPTGFAFFEPGDRARRAQQRVFGPQQAFGAPGSAGVLPGHHGGFRDPTSQPPRSAGLVGRGGGLPGGSGPASYGFGPVPSSASGASEGADSFALQQQVMALSMRLQHLEAVQSEALAEQSVSPLRTGTAHAGSARGGGAAAVRTMRPRTTGRTAPGSAPAGGRRRGRVGSSSGASADSGERRTALVKPMVEAAESQLGNVHGTLLHVGDLMMRLQQVYLNRGEIAEKRFLAASLIQAVVRGFITRHRYKAAKRGFGRWRRRHAKPMVLSYQIYSDKVEQIRQWTAQVQISRELRLRTTVLRSWHQYTMSQSPLKREQAAAAANMFLSMQNRLMRIILLSWRDTAWGRHSRKNIQAKYRRRHDAVRAKLEDKALRWAEKHGGAPARVTKDMIQHELTLDAIRVTQARMRLLDMRLPFNRWNDEYLQPLLEKTKIATKHFADKSYQKYFAAWKAYFDKFAGVIEKRDAQRKRFKQRQNMRMVEEHARRTMETKHFKAWAEYVRQAILAKQKVQSVRDALCVRVLRAWHVRAHWQREARRLVMDQWREHSRRLYSVPFRAWYLWAKQSRTEKMTQRTLLNAWQRRKTRQQMYTTFKHWAHKAIYGKIEGLHSRSELVRSLEEQKRHAHALETALSECQATLKQAEEALQAEVKARAEREEHYREKETKAIDAQFALDHAEAEVVRLQTIVDSVAKIHPGTMKHLMEVDEDKRFDDRGMTSVTRFAVEQKAKVADDKRASAGLSLDFGAPAASKATRARQKTAKAIDAELGEDDFLAGLDPRRLPDLSVASSIFHSEAAAIEASGTHIGAEEDMGRAALEGRRRRRAWSIDLGNVHRITSITDPIPRDDAADAPIKRAPDGGEGGRRRRRSVVQAKDADGILRVHERRRSGVEDDFRLRAEPLVKPDPATEGGIEARAKMAAQRAVGVGRIAWVQAEDAALLRRLKQVVDHLEDMNHAKARFERALAELAEKRERAREERARKMRLRKILNKQDEKVNRRSRKHRDADSLQKASAGQTLKQDVSDVGNVSTDEEGGSRSGDSARKGDSDAYDHSDDDDDDVSADSETEMLEDEEQFMEEAGKLARRSAPTDGEVHAIDSLVEVYKVAAGKQDESELRRVELKRWVATWAYIMEGKRIWIGPAGEEDEDLVDETEVQRQMAIESYVAGLPNPTRTSHASGGAGEEQKETGDAELATRKRRAAAAKDRAEMAVVLRDTGDAETSTWGAFVQGISYNYPTRHPEFSTTQEKLDVAQTARRKELVEKKKRLRAGLNLYKQESFYGAKPGV